MNQYKRNGRRDFLLTGFTAGVAGITFLACNKDDDDPANKPPEGSIDLGKGDTGILNYAFALEQLEAAFYMQVIASPFTGMTADERMLLMDIRDHEIAHRDFFKMALGTNAVPMLETDFSVVDFSNRDSVLSTAKTFEDLGVSAYNGAAQLIQNADYLMLAGKIVSVEARHAALIRDLISNGTFADGTAVNSDGLDLVNDPLTVLAAAAPFLKSKIWAGNLPNS
ncbi:ferritin-like domain-containing protein [Flavihumibacter petaseus]|uniref:Ferritin-like domain-containing protein n=1 Tax=Flavihumibacter petaseus NBRC 106054 TaxID=1220578 RepID=A0A0E9N7P3_9BACT|nr:ferritin-like domain-containing protein [Flavihumibacter petaseus]GAO45741.1 hypothetical protein FPE01S_18_00040 [Flavihumibacter petaseus NBRC 106054]